MVRLGGSQMIHNQPAVLWQRDHSSLVIDGISQSLIPIVLPLPEFLILAKHLSMRPIPSR